MSSIMLRAVLVYILAILTFVHCQRSNEAIDSSYLESVLDAAECDQQLEFIRNNVLLGLQFADAGIRIPKGILDGGLVDFGNYHQCLAIEHLTNNMNIEGKYCAIEVPVDQEITMPSFDNSVNNWRYNSSYLDKTSMNKIARFNLLQAKIQALTGDMDVLKKFYARAGGEDPFSGAEFIFGLCVPKPCTVKQAINSLVNDVTELDFKYTEMYCRLPGDKPWSGADIAAVTIFSLIALFTLLSTVYDLYHRLILKSDTKAINSVCTSFSVYTNSKRLTTFTSAPGTLQCIDGVRSLAMMWVIFGHTFASEPFMANPVDSFSWLMSANGLWLSVAPMTVDTFFTLSGILVVYTTAGKMSGTKLLKNLHWFYLSRMVRIMPLLAVFILLQSSFFNHMADGPFWQSVAINTNTCRNYWWYTLLSIHNIFAKENMCGGHTWYIAIDVQLYIVSPLILFWVLTGNKLKAWISLLSTFSTILVAATVYNYFKNFPAAVIVPTRGSDAFDYMMNYYINPLTRAAPFFVGLIFGYLLYLYRGKNVLMSRVLAILLWIGSFGIVASIVYFNYRIMQMDWDNQFIDNFMNSFMRPAWGCVIGWIIFACTHGYGGPINWFLSLDMWRLPSRLSYGMYLLHFPFMYSINGTAMTPIFFSPGGFTFKFLSYLTLAFVVAYVVTILVDSPVSTLYKQLTIAVQPKKELREEIKPEKSHNGNETRDLNAESKVADEIRHRNIPVITVE